MLSSNSGGKHGGQDGTSCSWSPAVSVLRSAIEGSSSFKETLVDAVVPSRGTSCTGGAAGLSPTLFMLPLISWAADKLWGGRRGGEPVASASLPSGLDDSVAMMRSAALETSTSVELLESSSCRFPLVADQLVSRRRPRVNFGILDPVLLSIRTSFAERLTNGERGGRGSPRLLFLLLRPSPSLLEVSIGPNNRSAKAQSFQRRVPRSGIAYVSSTTTAVPVGVVGCG